MTSAGVAVDTVLRRVHDDEGRITSRDFVRARLSDSQRLINALTLAVLDTTTLAAEPERCFYPLVGVLPQSTKVAFVQQGARNLVYTPWRTFWFLPDGWVRKFASQYELWSAIGRDVLVVWPASQKAETLTILSARDTAELVIDADLFEVPDEIIPMVTDLTTALVYLKQRNYGPIPEVIASLKGRLADRGTSLR